MQLTLYKFNKKINSTFQPVDTNVTGSNVSGKLINNCSIINPVIEMEYGVGGLNNVQDYNYVYIPTFNRYYFINNITFNNSKWILSLQCDVLASFKRTILDSYQYVLRSGKSYTIGLIDDVYPTIMAQSTPDKYTSTALGTIQQYNRSTDTWVDSQFFNQSFTSGRYVVGIYSDNISGVSWYTMPPSTFKDLIKEAMLYEPSDMLASNIPNGYARAIYDVTQYIVACYWYPFKIYNYVAVGGTRYFKFGAYTVDIGYSDTFAYPIDTTGVEQFKISNIPLPHHPQSVSMDTAWHNYSPYSEYGLWFQPFGNIPLDSAKMFHSGEPTDNKIFVYFKVDVTTGQSLFQVMSRYGGVIAERNTQIGIPIPISTMTLSDTGALIAGGVGLGEYIASNMKKNSTISSAITKFDSFLKNTMSAIAEDKYNIVPDTIQNYYSSLVTATQPDNFNVGNAILEATGITFGQLNTKGSPGSNLGYNVGSPYIYAWFYPTVEMSPEKFGRPLRATKQLSDQTLTTGSFIQCANASLSNHNESDAYPTVNETAEILNYLNTGMYINPQYQPSSN